MLLLAWPEELTALVQSEYALNLGEHLITAQTGAGRSTCVRRRSHVASVVRAVSVYACVLVRRGVAANAMSSRR